MTKISSYKGRYHRTVGKFINSSGKLARKKFLLGTDEAAARRKVERLELLWAEVKLRHQQYRQDKARYGLNYQGTYNRLDGTCEQGPMPAEAVWDAEALAVADAICKEQPSITVPHLTRELGDGRRVGEGAEVYLERLASLQADYKNITFIADPAAYGQAQAKVIKQVEQLGHEAAKLSRLASTDVTWAPGGMLHEAYDAYIKWLHSKYTRDGKLTDNGEKLVSATKRLKAASPDMPLDRLGHDAMEELAWYWYQRPKAKRPDGTEYDKPISISTVENMIKLLRRFLMWLNNTDAYTWQTTEHNIRTATKGHRLQDLLTEAEKKQAAAGPESWTRDELITLYQHATDRERVYMLMGLNAGFAQSELVHLDHNELDVDGDPPLLSYMRHKTGRKGGAKLWPETVKAIRWIYAEQSGKGSGRAILKAGGGQLDAQAISNSWIKLLDRVQQSDPDFRRLPFKFLRKTAAQLLQDQGNADSETIAIMEARAKWTGHDKQADRYYRRKLDRVYAANDKVHTYLAPMFAVAPDAFTKSRKKGGGNISAELIKRIHDEYAKCGNKTKVAKRLNISRQTVHRHLSKQTPRQH